MMEQGHKQASWSAAGAASPNNFVGSNVITYQTAACVTGQRVVRRVDLVADEE